MFFLPIYDLIIPDNHSPLPSGFLLHNYWKWSIYSWFTELKDGDFPVRYVNVYQRVDFEGDYNNLGKL